MEEDSQDEDDTLRNYYAKRKEKKKKREKKKGERRSVSGEAESIDNEGQDMHEGNTLDHTKLTTLTSADEDTLQNVNHTSSTSEGIPSSPHYTSHLGLQDNEVNLDEDVLLDFNDFTSETASPRPPGQATQDEDVSIEVVASPNQAEGSEQATSVQEDNSNLLDQGSSGDQIQPAIDASTTSLALLQDDTSLATPQENTSLALLQANTSILTVDVLNDIVKGGRSTSPIREHTSDLDFFNIKEQRYHQHMQKFRNGDGSYTVSHPIAM
jgi:hypothetical protein